MRKLSIAVVALLVVAVAAAVATAATKPIAFTGKYAGTATTKAADTSATINAAGAGAGAVIGAGKIVGVGAADTQQRPCLPFTGTGTMSGPGGSLVFKVNPTSSACGDEAGQTFSFTGKVTVLKGTGKLLKRKGLLRMTGTYDRSDGSFTVKFTGALTR